MNTHQSESQRIGQIAARAKWLQDELWDRIFAQFPDCTEEMVRSAARRYRRNHPDEFMDEDDDEDADLMELEDTFNEPDPRDGTYVDASRENVVFVQRGSEEEGLLRDFIVEMNPDPDIWEPYRPGIKKHTAWRKKEDKDLVFDHGVISGYVKSSGILAVPFFNMWCSFVRKDLVGVAPLIQPVAFKHKYVRLDKPTQTAGLQRTLFASDFQIGYRKALENAKLEPFHDRRGIDAICQVLAAERFDNLIIGGDFLDMTEWNRRYVRDPEFYWTTQPAIFEGAWVLGRMRTVSKNKHIKIIYLEGNHDARLSRYIKKHVQAAYGLVPADGIDLPALSIPRLLDLDSIGVEFVGGYPAEVYHLAHTVDCSHGNIARAPGQTESRMIQRAAVTKVHGHTHRNEQVSECRELAMGVTERITSVSFGCVCRKNIPGADDSAQWQEAFGVIEHDDAVAHSIEHIFIDSGECSWRGDVFSGHDYAADLREAFPAWNW